MALGTVLCKLLRAGMMEIMEEGGKQEMKKRRGDARKFEMTERNQKVDTR